MLVLHWFVGNDEDNVMGVVSHDHLANYFKSILQSLLGSLTRCRQQ